MSDTIAKFWKMKDAERYDSDSRTSGRMKAYDWVASNAKAHLSKEGAISLDLGCGTGLFAEAVGVRSIIGVDISPSMLELARKRMDTVWEKNIFELQLENSSIDNIISLFVIDDYLSEKKFVFFRKVFDSMKPGGRFFFSAYSPDDGYMGKIHEITLKNGGGSFKVHLEDASFYENMLEECGFIVDNIELIHSRGEIERDSRVKELKREFILIVARKP